VKYEVEWLQANDNRARTDSRPVVVWLAGQGQALDHFIRASVIVDL
jgi:hypothetical protein